MESNEKLRVLMAAIIASGALGSAQAQTKTEATDEKPEVNKLGTVVVTASRRTEPLQQVPIPVSTIDRQTLRDGGLQDLKAFTEMTPNATLPVSSTNNNNQDVIIRGVRNPGGDGSSSVEPGFGLYRDGNYYGGTVTSFGAFVDVARVEVLRGPQGGLYGRNAVGGAINVIYEKPRGVLGGEVNAVFGELGTRNVDAVLNAPLSEALTARAAVWSQKRDGGEVVNSFLGRNVDATKDDGGRLSLSLAATSNLSVDWVAETSDSRLPMNTYFMPKGRTLTFAGLPPNFTLGPSPVPGLNLGFASIATQAPETEKTIQRDTFAGIHRKHRYLSQEIGYDAGDLGTFTLATTYRKLNQDGAEDQDVSAVDPAKNPRMIRSVGVFDTRGVNKFIELRWVSPESKPMTWVAGASHYSEDLVSNRAFELLRIDAAAGNIPGRVDFLGTQKTESDSIFGEINWRLGDAYKLSASLRHTSDKRSIVYHQGQDASLPLASAVFIDIPGLFVSPHGAIIAAGIPSFDAARSAKFSNTSPGATLSYTHSKDMSFYGRIQSGFRSGGYNLTAPVDKLSFNPETALNYEVGMKSDWLNNTLRVNATAFQMNQKDVLLPQSSLVNGSPLGYLVNGGKARTKGFELEVNALVAKGLTVGMALGYLDAKQTEGVDTLGNSLAGKQIPYATRFTSNLMANYRTPIADGINLMIYGSYRHRQGGYADPANTAPYKLPGFDLFDASIGVEGKSWSLSLVAQNLTDQRYEAFRSSPLTAGDPNSYLTSISPGRWLGVKGSLKF